VRLTFSTGRIVATEQVSFSTAINENALATAL